LPPRRRIVGGWLSVTPFFQAAGPRPACPFVLISAAGSREASCVKASSERNRAGCAFVRATTGLRHEKWAIADQPRCWGSCCVRLLLRTEKNPPASASRFLGRLLTLRVEFDVGGDGGAESSSSRGECASARVGRRCTESRSQVVAAAGSRVCRKAERSSPWTRLLSCDRSDFVQRR
jgi:hypothetical protein